MELYKATIGILKKQLEMFDGAADSLKAQVITDMPLNFGGKGSKTENALYKQEDIQHLIKKVAVKLAIEEQKIKYAHDSLERLDGKKRYIIEQEFIYNKKPKEVMIGLARDFNFYIAETTYYKKKRQAKKELKK